MDACVACVWKDHRRALSTGGVFECENFKAHVARPFDVSTPQQLSNRSAWLGFCYKDAKLFPVVRRDKKVASIAQDVSVSFLVFGDHSMARDSRRPTMHRSEQDSNHSVLPYRS